MAKRHHASKRHHHMNEHHMPEHMHAGHPRRGMKMKYDTLRHERDMFNDEKRHDSEPMPGGPYHYDRERREDYSEPYAGRSGRRRQEMADAGMIHEDHAAIANLPQRVEIKPYPKNMKYLPEDLDDTIRGVDRQIDYDDSKKLSHFYPKKV